MWFSRTWQESCVMETRRGIELMPSALKLQQLSRLQTARGHAAHCMSKVSEHRQAVQSSRASGISCRWVHRSAMSHACGTQRLEENEIRDSTIIRQHSHVNQGLFRWLVWPDLKPAFLLCCARMETSCFGLEG